MEPYKWYDASEVLPEDTDLDMDHLGVVGDFAVALKNGDIYCAKRWYNDWVKILEWDTDNDFIDRYIKNDGISHWMLLIRPKQ